MRISDWSSDVCSSDLATGGGTITGPLQLLLVEDDPTVAEVVTGLLRAQGHAVVHAAHGLAALSETAAPSFDLALLDLDLPGLDGFALARQLRTSGLTAPPLAVTARANPDAEPQATIGRASGRERGGKAGKTPEDTE